MRQKTTDQKVRFKLYKDGKQWVTAGIATGIAIPVALFSAALLAPVTNVQATSADAGYVYPGNGEASVFSDAIKKGYLYDATTNGTSSVQIEATQMKAIEAANMKLILRDDQWQIEPMSNDQKVDFNTVLGQIGFPAADVLSAPTSGSNEQTLLSYLADSGALTVNGGSMVGVNNGVKNRLLSGSGIAMNGSNTLSAESTPIGTTPYSAIVSGPLNKLVVDGGLPNGKTLITDGGTLQGSGRLSTAMTNSLTQYSFSDGSMADEMRAVRSAATSLLAYWGTKVSADSAQTKSKTGGDAATCEFDFSKATQDDNGNWIFNFNADNFNSANFNNFKFTNTDLYKGGNVILQVSGNSDLEFPHEADSFVQSASFITGGKLYLAVPNGNKITIPNAASAGKNVNLIAPTSDYVSTEPCYNGIVGLINGTADGDGSNGPGGDGYHKPEGGDTIAKVPDPTTKPDGNDTPTTDDKTPKTATITENFTYQLAGADKIDKTYQPSLGADLKKTLTATIIDGKASLDGDVAEAPQVKDGTYKNAAGTDYTIFTDKNGTWAKFTADDGTVYTYKVTVTYDNPAYTNAKQVNAAKETLKAGDKIAYGVHVTYTFDDAAKAQTGEPIGAGVKVDQGISATPVKVQQTIHYRYADGVDGDPAALPKDTTETVNAIKDGDNKVYLDGSFVDQPTVDEIKITADNGDVTVLEGTADNAGWDESAIVNKVKTADDSLITNIINVIYAPSTTTKHKTVTVTDEVNYDYDVNDFESDTTLLPKGYDRTATVSYVETTDSQGHKSYSDWQMQKGLDSLKVPQLDGYTAETDNDLTDDGILQMVEQSGPMQGAFVMTDVIYLMTPEQKIKEDTSRAQVPDGISSTEIGLKPASVSHYEEGAVPDGISSTEIGLKPASVSHYEEGAVPDGISSKEIDATPDSVSHYEEGEVPDGISSKEIDATPDSVSHYEEGKVPDGISSKEIDATPDSVSHYEEGEVPDGISSKEIDATPDSVSHYEEGEVPDGISSKEIDATPDSVSHYEEGAVPDGISSKEIDATPDSVSHYEEGAVPDGISSTEIGLKPASVSHYEEGAVPDGISSKEIDATPDSVSHYEEGEVPDGISSKEIDATPDSVSHYEEGEVPDGISSKEIDATPDSVSHYEEGAVPDGISSKEIDATPDSVSHYEEGEVPDGISSKEIDATPDSVSHYEEGAVPDGISSKEIDATPDSVSHYEEGEVPDGISSKEIDATPDSVSHYEEGEVPDGISSKEIDATPDSVSHYEEGAVPDGISSKEIDATPDSVSHYEEGAVPDGISSKEIDATPDSVSHYEEGAVPDGISSKEIDATPDSVSHYEEGEVPDGISSKEIDATPDSVSHYEEGAVPDGISSKEIDATPDSVSHYEEGEVPDGISSKEIDATPDSVSHYEEGAVPDGISSKEIDATPDSVSHYEEGAVPDGIQVKAEVPDAVQATGTVGDGIQTKNVVETGNPISVSTDNYYDLTDVPTPSGDDTPTPSGDDTPTPSGDDTPTPSGDDTPTPSGDDTPTPSGDDTPTPSGDDTPTPSGDDTPTPSGDDTPTPSGDNTPTPSGDDTPTPSDDDTPTPSTDDTPTPSTVGTPTPSTDDTPTPSTDDTPTPSTDDTPTPSTDDTPTPSGDDTPTPVTDDTPTPVTPVTTGTPTGSTNGTPTLTTPSTPRPTAGNTLTPLTGNATPASNTPQTTTVPAQATATTGTNTTATTNATTLSNGNVAQFRTAVDATQAPAAAAAVKTAQDAKAPQAGQSADDVDPAKPDAVPGANALANILPNVPTATADAGNTVSPVIDVIDSKTNLTHGNIFIAGGAPGMADYTFFSQPVMNTTTNSVDHYELLLRVWDSKQGGWHLPASFSIPASMEAHLMARAVAQLDVKDVSINLTEAQFEDPDTQKAITELAQSDQVDKMTVELGAIPTSEALDAHAATYQKAGVTITLDNLGSHTDGTQVAKVADKVDTLKVSLRRMRQDGSNLTQISSQLSAWQKAASAHGDVLEVEGVETSDELAVTTGLGITNVQGYYFSRPAMPGTRADLI